MNQTSNQPPNDSPKQPPSQTPPVTFPLEPSRQPPSGRPKRWAVIGCGAGLVAVVFFLIASISMVKRGMYNLVDRGCDRIERRLPLELRPQQRARIKRNLERLKFELERAEDPDPLVGSFLGQVARALEDDHLSVREVRELSDFLETSLPPEEEPIRPESVDSARPEDSGHE
jgi:hypothetical protein